MPAQHNTRPTTTSIVRAQLQEGADAADALGRDGGGVWTGAPEKESPGICNEGTEPGEGQNKDAAEVFRDGSVCEEIEDMVAERGTAPMEDTGAEAFRDGSACEEIGGKMADKGTANTEEMGRRLSDGGADGIGEEEDESGLREGDSTTSGSISAIHSSAIAALAPEAPPEIDPMIWIEDRYWKIPRLYRDGGVAEEFWVRLINTWRKPPIPDRLPPDRWEEISRQPLFGNRWITDSHGQVRRSSDSPWKGWIKHGELRVVDLWDAKDGEWKSADRMRQWLRYCHRTEEVLGELIESFALAWYPILKRGRVLKEADLVGLRGDPDSVGMVHMLTMSYLCARITGDDYDRLAKSKMPAQHNTRPTTTSIARAQLQEGADAADEADALGGDGGRVWTGAPEKESSGICNIGTEGDDKDSAEVFRDGSACEEIEDMVAERGTAPMEDSGTEAFRDGSACQEIGGKTADEGTADTEEMGRRLSDRGADGIGEEEDEGGLREGDSTTSGSISAIHSSAV
ncbi:hypothetical protein CBR_g45804 [Chara braunii]|uniref:Uncharacterized protein n=1 Tax=Chara braunii TaxID=69332 RepID=A0A388LZF7_CHABU|nr:hypothetical protein CBR_g45804 [Chara braunii]|eukprot:GBG87651.1 hypothetical protein CBR_g45804 [Chara braunii]